jgi:uncharacterized membrane protein YdjX (TVP38/TMEM64 family)
MKNNLLFKFIVIIASLAMVWECRGYISAAWAWFSNRNAVTVSMQQAGIWGPVILFVLFVLQVFIAFIPGQALMVACGYLYGFWGGFLLSWLSLVAGGEAAFALARRYGRSFAGKWITADVLARWDQTAQGQGIGFFAITLLMPLVPNDAMCYVAGLGRISRPRFFIANLIGRGLACLFTSAAGAFGAALSWQGWAVLIVTFVLIGLTWYLARNRISKLLLA